MFSPDSESLVMRDCVMHLFHVWPNLESSRSPRREAWAGNQDRARRLTRRLDEACGTAPTGKVENDGGLRKPPGNRIGSGQRRYCEQSTVRRQQDSVVELGIGGGSSTDPPNKDLLGLLGQHRARPR